MDESGGPYDMLVTGQILHESTSLRYLKLSNSQKQKIEWIFTGAWAGAARRKK